MNYYIPEGSWPLKVKLYHKLLYNAGLKQAYSREKADILVLPGGSDIGMRTARDEAEFMLYKQWTDSAQPVIGICRGMQLALVATGNKIIKHIPDVLNEYIHTTTTGTWLGKSNWHVTELGINTNSRHHQGFTHVNKEWIVLDSTSDGIIESVTQHNQFFVQWHPEQPEMANTPANDWWFTTLNNIINI